MRQEVTEKELFAIALPQQTETYIPVSNQLLINKVKEIAGDYGLFPIKQRYQIAKEGDVMTGVINFGGEDKEMGMSIGLRNSYDKSKTLAIGSGANVMVCTNGMFRADIIEMRKHTGNVILELEHIIERQIIQMQNEFYDLVNFKNRAKEIKVGRIVTSHLIGEMFYEQDLITTTQMSVIKKEMNSTTFGVMGEKVSLWNIYNWITESYKSEHPSNFLNKHVEFHNYFENKFELV